MKPHTRVALRLARQKCQQATCEKNVHLPSSSSSSSSSSFSAAHRLIHSTPTTPATVQPIHGTGPPPTAPEPAADARLARRKKHAELLQRAQEIRSSVLSRGSDTSKSSTTTTTPLARRRFWKHVHVKEVNDGKELEIHLDTRPLRRPANKEVVRIPASKPLLAAALAAEWDMIVSAQQATKQHLIPLTSLINRALDIADDDAGKRVYLVHPNDVVEKGGEEEVEPKMTEGKGELRAGIAKMLMRYLDTDTLLCWAPPPRHGHDAPDARGKTLRELQMAATEEVVSYLTANVWPGVEIIPVLDGDSIMPRSQNPETRQVIEGWITGLSAWELAGLEKAVLAGKGLLGAVRLLVEWSEGFAGLGKNIEVGQKPFGVEEATQLANIEVDWQIGNWGEVEDTHDVEREDLRRQFGSVVLLVSGTGRQQ
ncbi:hypothetical protein GGS20DRAFT_542730 [Poronia punctata]|nr:hypothetical protein GGS20DRAFT_542730 [Poronia punctata]